MSTFIAAATLEEARKNCSPKPLVERGELAGFWVETEDARDKLTSFRGTLGPIPTVETPQKVLVHGHRGCGKSTEISKFLSGLGSEWLVVRLNTPDFLPVSGNEAADVLLAASTRLLDVAEDKELKVEDRHLQAVYEYFAETVTEKHSGNSNEQTAEAGADVGASVLGKLIGLKAQAVASLKYGSRTETSTVSRVRRRKGELCAAVNALGLAVEKAWQKKTDNRSAKLLLVLEDLDKLGLADARQIFVHDARILSEVNLRAIYTIPVFTFHSADAGAIRSYFEHDLALPMIKVCEPDGKPCDEGRKVLREIIRRRVSATVLPDDAVDHLIERTGGVLRDIFDAIQLAVQFKPVQKSGVIDKTSVGLALDRMVNLLGTQISYPPETAKDPKPLQEKLAAIAKAQSQGKTPPTQPDPDLQLLLMSGSLIEYNGNRWLGVHPLARQYLKKLGYDVGVGES